MIASKKQFSGSSKHFEPVKTNVYLSNKTLTIQIVKEPEDVSFIFCGGCGLLFIRKMCKSSENLGRGRLNINVMKNLIFMPIQIKLYSYMMGRHRRIYTKWQFCAIFLITLFHHRCFQKEVSEIKADTGSGKGRKKSKQFTSLIVPSI